MAEKRMFKLKLIDSDAFLDMPATTQLLYFHLAMRADDDGFIDNPKKIQRICGCGDDDLKLLLAKSFILAFDSGVIVIKHWKLHNCIQKDRYKPTIYQSEKSQLGEDKTHVYSLDTECIQSVSEMEPQVRLDKIRLDKDRLDITTTAQGIDLSTAVILIENMMLQHWKRKPEENDIEQALKQLERLNGNFDMLADALDIAAQHGTRAKNWNYTTAIIDSWIAKGYKTEEDVLLGEMKRKGGTR